jgi:hypothetical protein
MRPFSDLFGSSQFIDGLLVGIVALLFTLPIALLLAIWFPARTKRPGLVGAVFVIASVLAIRGVAGTDEIWTIPTDLIVGLALLWLAGTIAARTPAPWLVGAIAAIPGAVVVAGANDGRSDGWVPVLIVVGTVVVGATAADLDRRTARYGLGPLLLFIAVGGIYVTVPDTELMRAVVGVAAPLVLLAWPYAAASIGAGGAYAAVGLLLWIAPIEGLGRPGSIVGVLGAFALLYGEPLGRALAAQLQTRMSIHRFPIKRPRVIVVAGQVVLTLYATRVAGLVYDGATALLLMIPGFAAAIAFGVFLVIPERKRRTHKRRRSSGSSVPRPTSNGATKHHGRHGHGPSAN